MSSISTLTPTVTFAGSHGPESVRSVIEFRYISRFEEVIDGYPGKGGEVWKADGRKVDV